MKYIHDHDSGLSLYRHNIIRHNIERLNTCVCNMYIYIYMYTIYTYILYIYIHLYGYTIFELNDEVVSTSQIFVEDAFRRGDFWR